ncbi:hypothetical protein QQS21_009268 [Conoideocrella luteorostrata]|uniref:Telomeric single stranded DNA binding POT1/Cdc13 domain-containing protein n=1 Tax=Conoideocrella luteorostrata TaxID=1105319 RepID=A0AAJ0CJX6_9HYPO|nr:hypothetical protein QQS21_009268 [Conoideocrella luteorostrata]
MADPPPPLEVLRDVVPTPIAQLNPGLDQANSRAVNGVVTITWPYSIVTNSIAFILAEHDVLLRRNRGQLRVEFHGAAGKALADANIGGGDEVQLSLDACQWTENAVKAGLPAGSLEWQLNFTNRLLLSIRRDGSPELELVHVNSPDDRSDCPLELESMPQTTSPAEPLDPEHNIDNATPDLRPPDSAVTAGSKRLASSTFEVEEYASPAFIKRARVSYGSLFEGDMNIFGDDKGKKRKSRRQSRFSMGNTVWRYSSRSPSPESKEESEPESLEDASSEVANETAFPSIVAPASQRSTMVDEGCQTQELHFSPPMNGQVSTEASVSKAVAPESPSRQYAAGHGTTGHTPSRTLFGQLHMQYDLPGSMAEPITSQIATSLPDHHFGFAIPLAQADESIPDFNTVPASSLPISSISPTHEAINAASYPGVGMTGHNYAEPTLPHDHSLQFHRNIHEPHHEFQSIVEGNLPWQSETAPSYPPIPHENFKSQAAVFIDSSPPPEEGNNPGQPRSLSPSVVDYASEDDQVSPVGDAAHDKSEDEEEGRRRHVNEQEGSGSEDDGGDLNGEDYDLRNYSRTRDDDASEEEPEQGLDVGSSDAERQAIAFQEQEDRGSDESAHEDEEGSEDGELDEEVKEDDEERYRWKSNMLSGGMNEESAGSAGEESIDAEYDEQYDNEEDLDGEGNEYSESEEFEGEEYYEDDEEGYEGEEDDEEEQEELPSAPSGPKEPVIIDLLSDSDDDSGSGEDVDEEPSKQNIDGSQLVGQVSSAQDETTAQAGAETSTRAINVVRDEAGVEKHSLETDEAVGDDPNEPAVDQTHDAEVGEALEEEEYSLETDEAMENDSNEPAVDRTHDAAAGEALEEEDYQDAMKVNNKGDDDVDDKMGDEVEGEVALSADHIVTETAKAEDDVEYEVMEQDATITVATEGNIAQVSSVEKEPENQGSKEPVPDQTKSGQPTDEKTDVEMAEIAPAGDEKLPDGSPEVAAVTEAEPQELEQQQTEEPEVDSPKNRQLPTPVETQPPPRIESARQDQGQADDIDNDSEAAEDQIMDELRKYQYLTEQGPQAISKQVATNTKGEDASQEASQKEQQSEEQDVLITVKSLRSHSHRRTGSSDSTSSYIEDPSLLLAQASSQSQPPTKVTEPEPQQEHGPEPANEAISPGILRVSRSAKSGHLDPSILLAKASVESPTKQNEQTPSMRVTRSMTEHSEQSEEQKMPSPVGTRNSKRLATPEPSQFQKETQEALESPSVTSSFVEDESLSVLKRQMAKDLRTKLPDYLSLRSLRTSLNKITDVLAVATSTPPQPHRPKHGPRGYMLELTLVDPSSAPSGISIGHIFRPHQASLPVVHAGDLILLRRVQVVAMKGRGFGVRVTDASAWAVFEKGDEEMLAQIKGPPVEVADEEVEYAAGLRRWWEALDEKALVKINKATQKIIQNQGST